MAYGSDRNTVFGSKITHHPMAGRLPTPNTYTKVRAFNATVKM